MSCDASYPTDAIMAAQTESEFPMIAMLEKLQRPTVVCNLGPPSDHRSKINIIDMGKNLYVNHKHSKSGSCSTTVSDGKRP